MGQVLFVAAPLIGSWVNLVIVARRLGVRLPLFHHWLLIPMEYGLPVLTAGLAFYAWTAARAWWRMEELHSVIYCRVLSRASPSNMSSPMMCQACSPNARGMQDMLTWLRCNCCHQPVVIIDDITRFARGVEAHIKLRKLLASAGGTLESPSVEFGDASEPRLIEVMLASVAQHQREKNGEQTISRMRARCMNGYWVFQPPVGFR